MRSRERNNGRSEKHPRSARVESSAGAPVLNFVDTVAQSLLNGLVLVETPVPVAKMKLVSDAVYARCVPRTG